MYEPKPVAESVPWDEEIIRLVERCGGLWTCQVCGYTSKYKSHMIEHVEAKHVEHPPYVCGICDKQFKARNGFRQHFVKSHNNDIFSLPFQGLLSS